jgi:AcrR family transcriptional regulator
MLSTVPTISASPAKRPSRADVRDQILRAALEVFAESGFDRASLDDVAHRAGFTKGAVYSNFRSKDDVFFALMEQQIQLRLTKVASVVESLAAADSSLVIGEVLATISVTEREWQLLFLDYWARAVRDPDVRAGFVQHRRRLRSLIASAIDDLFPENEKRALSSRDLATVTLALSNGYAIEALPDPDDANPKLVGLVLEQLVS